MTQELIWQKFQIDLASKRIVGNNLSFDTNDFNNLKYVGGCDVSFIKSNNSNLDGTIGFASIVILEYPSLKMIYNKSSPFKTDIPYKSGYLSFREYPIILELLNELKNENKFYPQILLVDGCGIYHPRKCGLACTIGILADLPTIGISKNFLVINDQELTMDWMKSKTKALCIGKSVDLCGRDGFIYGTAMRTSIAENPIFTSPGNMISVDTATRLVLTMCKYRIPEPIRMADQLSRRLCKS
jgi:deoxyinosine 3'endonuclease (endonuclease V)